ncbi:MAG: hypothetical protein AAGJ18_25365 [Bacteroidota bacterium]
MLKGNRYELVLKSGEGIIRSQAVKNFNIPILSIFDRKENQRVLRLILQDNLPK